jgi:hypothetical protein|tara:strand:- start:480 stop:1340 length:861 start_codon:yes stop_codon:yes gene_type:complete
MLSLENQMRVLKLISLLVFTAVMMASFNASAAQAKDRAEVERFLNVTGFDVSLDSIRLSAKSAPMMLGLDADDFGYQWTLLANDIFASEIMREMALDMLSEALSAELLEHAVGFYASELGERLVEVENASHLSDDNELKSESGEAIVDGLIRIGSPRIELLKRMNAASDAAGTSVRAIQEVQVRFLMAAAGAGVIELSLDEADLREMLRNEEAELRFSLQASGLAGAAYTYQAFSDSEVEEYTKALENPKMQKIYDLMNAVQFSIMADRYEELAVRMATLQPSEDL